MLNLNVMDMMENVYNFMKSKFKIQPPGGHRWHRQQVQLQRTPCSIFQSVSIILVAI